MNWITWMVWLFYGYMALGALFAIYFVWHGAARLDEAARGISWKTRVLFFPGATALWPVLLRKCLRRPTEAIHSPENNSRP